MDNLSMDKLNDLMESNSFLIKESDKSDKSDIKEYDSITKKILDDLKSTPGKVKNDNNVNWYFVLTFGTAITAFYPIIESFIVNSGQSFDGDMKTTVVYLTLCALAIALKKPKEQYRKLFEELRLRGVYKFLKPTVAIMNVMKKIFRVIAKKTGEVITGIVDMFAYTALFVPFVLIVQDLVALNSISIDGFISAFSGDWVGKLMSVGISLGTITVKHFFIDLINNLKKFKDKGIESIKKVINKIKKFSLSQFLFGDNKKSINNDIKKFTDFDSDEIINENKYKDLEEKWGSLGVYVENIKKEIGDDEDKEIGFLRLIGKYLGNKPDIRIANAVDLLNGYDQRLLVKELQDGFLTESSSVTAKEFLNDIEDISLSGKGGFNSFLKVINALNLPEIKPDIDNCPQDFSLIFSMESLNKERLLTLMKRFKSLNSAIRIIENINDNIIGVYFGLKYESKRFWVEYGLLADDKRYIVGEFKFGSPQFRKMMERKNKVLKSFQEEMKNVDLKDLKTLMVIKNDFTNFSPGYFQKKSNALIKDNVLIQGYYGIGKWDSGTLSDESYSKLKDEFKQWVLSHKWKEQVLINIKPGKFWVYFKIKLKGNNEDI